MTDEHKMLPTECPYCGCTDAYPKVRAEGLVTVRYDLAARAIDYSSMWDGLDTVYGKYLYCDNCGKRIGKEADATDFKNAADIHGYMF